MASARPKNGPRVLAVARAQPDQAVRTIDLWIERSRQRRALGEIAGLDAHLLRDIGVPQDVAQREAAKPFWMHGMKSNRFSKVSPTRSCWLLDRVPFTIPKRPLNMRGGLSP